MKAKTTRVSRKIQISKAAVKLVKKGVNGMIIPHDDLQTEYMNNLVPNKGTLEWKNYVNQRPKDRNDINKYLSEVLTIDYWLENIPKEGSKLLIGIESHNRFELRRTQKDINTHKNTIEEAKIRKHGFSKYALKLDGIIDQNENNIRKQIEEGETKLERIALPAKVKKNISGFFTQATEYLDKL